MIIDIHQHLVRLAKHQKIEGFREGQLAGKNPALPKLSDEEIRAELETVLNLMTNRGINMAGASPRAKAMATHVGTVEQNQEWADLNNSLVLRAANLYKGKFAPIGMLGQHPSNPGLECSRQVVKWVSRDFIAFNFDPDGTGGKWENSLFTGRQWYPLFDAAQAMGTPLVIHGSESCNPNMPHTAIQYLVADMMLWHLIAAKDLFKDFPALRFVIPHGGGPLGCQDGRWRWLAAMNTYTPVEALLESGNIFLDTCVYSKRNMRTLFDTVPIDNLLFGSESDGAFPGIINPETGRNADHTKLYVDALGLSQEDSQKVFELNARQVYPNIEQWIPTNEKS